MKSSIRIVISLLIMTVFGIGADLELDQIVKDANKTDKPILMFIHKDGCGFCERMIFDIESKDISDRLAKDFILVDINRDDDETISFDGYEGSNRDFLKKLSVHLYPTVLFLDGNGSFVYNTIGYRNPKKIMTILNYISTKKYKKMTFEEFKDESLTDEE
jgi:thioredoxin-related protein